MFVEYDNSGIVVSVNKHCNVATVSLLLQVLEVATPRLIPLSKVVVWHYCHIILGTVTQSCYVYFTEQQCNIQSCTQVNQTTIPTSERALLLFAVPPYTAALINV